MPKTKNNQIVSINQPVLSLQNYNPNISLENYDSFIISSLSYQTADDVSLTYLLWCNQTNSYVATFSIPWYMYGLTYNAVNPVTPSVSLSPKFEIQITNPSNQLKFRLDVIDPLLFTISPVVTPNNFLSIVLSFNKY